MQFVYLQSSFRKIMNEVLAVIERRSTSKPQPKGKANPTLKCEKRTKYKKVHNLNPILTKLYFKIKDKISKSAI